MVKLILVDNDYKRYKAKVLISNYHSYVPTYNTVGREIDWLVVVDGEVVGMIGIGSSTYPPCKDILKRLGKSKAEYRDIFNTIANNWRFCLSKRIPNVGTQVLALLRRNAQIEWKRKYGDDLKYLITFVAGGNSGAVYKADNWEQIGYTAGLPSHKAVSMKWDDNDSIGQKFVKPTGENRKIIFFKELKPVRDVELVDETKRALF